jgi:hypothetical protein
MDASQAFLLQNDQIQAPADHQQLIGLIAVAEELTTAGTMHLSNQGFITG